MENKDKPAFAQLHDWPKESNFLGLTKREMFAMAAMQGILANPTNVVIDGVETKNTGDDVATAAIHYADTLLKQLESK